jgi:hypothetical protein
MLEQNLLLSCCYFVEVKESANTPFRSITWKAQKQFVRDENNKVE